MDKKYQVFVSSTYEDLKEEREQVIKAVLEMGHIPVGMEMFSAADEDQWKLIARQIEQSDYYVILVAHRYGSETKMGISYTEKEYDFACSLGVPTLGFIISDDASWPNNRVDKSAKKIKKLEAFKTKVKSKLVQFWSSKEDLHGKVSISLVKNMNINPRVGWIRASEAPSIEATQELLRLSAENAELRKKVEVATTTDQPDEEKKIVHILDDNVRTFRVRRKNNSKWNEADSFSNTLLEIFMIIGPTMVNESSSANIAKELSFEHVGNNWFRGGWSVGDNRVKGFVTDLIALDLVEASKKKHSVNDKEEYWSLTKTGKAILKKARRIQLEDGIKTVEEKSEED
ncbi:MULTISPECIES: DUF4062 domain-containing protein [Vibrio]|uniref:DUF4062 domain-containing protein n=1 Tax=Vibrio atlanticus TaxID=693153 RepID=A0ABV4KT30_9VIBR|nr:DUF4062 domain-containing protein [Vibrio tasmaniensis]OEF76826.1 hypothetical protein A162_16960 [Vibrio tasmaniensis 1F-155]PMO80096.1 hypothetical protein BCT01_09315 [Vibrio tasmaniensis]